MLKQLLSITLLVLFSIGIVLSIPYAQQGLQLLVSGHDWISQTLTDVFSGGQAGNLIRQSIALLVIPFIAGLVPVIIYWLIKRSWFPYFLECLWIIWLIQMAAIVIQFKLT